MAARVGYYVAEVVLRHRYLFSFARCFARAKTLALANGHNPGASLVAVAAELKETNEFPDESAGRSDRGLRCDSAENQKAAPLSRRTNNQRAMQFTSS